MKRTERHPETRPLRVLILEDDPSDAELVERQLRRGNAGVIVKRSDSRAGFQKCLKEFKPQAVLADFTLPGFDAMAALLLARKSDPTLPFIVVTGSIGEEKATACLRAGADDYLLKDRLTRLNEALHQALEKRRLQAENAVIQEGMRVNERLYRTFIDSSSDMAFLKDGKFRHVIANQALCRFYGRSEEEIRGKTDFELMARAAAGRCRRTDRLALKGRKAVVHEETVGDRVFETRKFPVRLVDGGTGVGGYIRDVTDKKRAETALDRAAANWTTTFDAMNDAVCQLDERGAIRQCNKAMNELLGMAPGKALGRDCLELICGRGKGSACALQQVLGDGRRHEEETFWRGRWYQIHVDPVIGPKGRTAGAVHVMSDITAAKLGEAQRRESEERFRGLYENAVLGMYRTTAGGRILLANPALVAMLGYGSFAELARRNLEQDGFEPDYPRQRFLAELEHQGRIIGMEAAWKRRDGTTIHVRESAVAVRDAKGALRYIDGTVEDISGRKHAEEALRDMSEIFRLFLKHNPIYVFIKDENIRAIHLSDNYEKMLGRPLAGILGKSMDELFPSEISRSMVEDDKGILRDGVVREFIEELHGRIYSTTKFPIVIDGRAKYLAGYTMDITERQHAEELLRERDQLLQNLSAQIPGMIYTFLRHPDGRYSIPYTSSVIKDIFGVSPQSVYDDASPIFAAIVAEDRPGTVAAIEESARTMTVWQHEYRVQLPGQSPRWMWGRSQPFRLPDGSILWYGFNAEVTERKQAEERIAASLREKEILLKEIHHRVKNNLQVISGLLTLQASQIDDERLTRMIQESQSRIWTMALIHQTLYQSGDMAAIDMADYIRTLAGNLLSSHARVAMPPSYRFDLQPLRLTIDRAIPLALIVNELLTNALKHAFPDGRAGEIRISLRAGADSAATAGAPRHARTMELIVADDGVGLPVNFAPEGQKHLGLQLVAMLSRQIRGTLACEQDNGARFRLAFPSHEKNEKHS